MALLTVSYGTLEFNNYLIPLNFRTPIIFAPLIFAPLIFAHRRNFIFRAPLIFAHQVHFAPLLFLRPLNFQDFQFFFCILFIWSFFQLIWDFSGNLLWSTRELTHFFKEKINWSSRSEGWFYRWIPVQMFVCPVFRWFFKFSNAFTIDFVKQLIIRPLA